MSGFQGRFQYVQEHAIPSIIDLGDMIDKSDSLIIWLYRHQSSTNKEKQMQIEKQINQTIENLRQSNLRYLKNSISNDRDRQLTENALNIIDTPVSYTHLTLPTKDTRCRSRWSPYH